MDGNQDVGSVQRAQDFFRLKETIESSGAIFELNESAKAIYIGPDSDIGEVQITYFNPDEPDALETANVSVNGPLVGRLDSLPVSIVPSTGQGARILVSPTDLVVSDYNPGAVLTGDLAAQRNFNVPVTLDLMVALKTLPAIPEVRADRTLRFPRVPFQISTSTVGSDGSTNLIVPIYGRRIITVVATCQTEETIVSGAIVSLALINLTPGNGEVVPRWLNNDQAGAEIRAPAIDPGRAPEPRAAVIRASDASRAGTTYLANGDVSGYYYESDQPPFLIGSSDPGRFSVRGMADLLLVNIREQPIGLPPAEQIGFCDIFLKLADRET